MDGEPVIPAPLPDDDDDVAWALQTAAVQWNRGQQGDAVVWIRRAVDAAIACGNARRTSDLARLASQVADMLAVRASQAPSAPLPSRPPSPSGSDVDDLLSAPPAAPGPPRPRASTHTLTSEIPFEVEEDDLADDDVEDVADRRLPYEVEDDDEEGVQPTLPPPAQREEHSVADYELLDPPATPSEPVYSVMPDELFSTPPASLGEVQSVHPEELFSGHPEAPMEDPPFDGFTEPYPVSGNSDLPGEARAGSAAPEPVDDTPPESEEPVDETPPRSGEQAAPAPAAFPSVHPSEAETADALAIPDAPRIVGLPEETTDVTESMPVDPVTDFAPVPSSDPVDAVSESGAPRGEGAGSTEVDGVALEGVSGFEDLPEEVQRELARAATLTTLGADEEIGGFGAALVTRGKVGLMPSIADIAASVAKRGDVVFTRGTLEEGILLRVVALENDTVVASWAESDLEQAMADFPWVADELRLVADRFQALAGALLGALGDSLDDNMRNQVFSRLSVKSYAPGETIVQGGKSVPGLHVLGAGKVELTEAGKPVTEVGPGDILFAAEVLGAGKAHATAVAGKGGALLLIAPRAVAHELLLSVPPLIEILAG